MTKITTPFFHKCPDAEEHVGMFAMSSFLNRLVTNADMSMCSRRFKIGEPTAYWLKYGNETVGLIKIKMLCDFPLYLAVTFHPLANLN